MCLLSFELFVACVGVTMLAQKLASYVTSVSESSGYTDASRVCRLLFIVENQQLLLKKEHIHRLNNKESTEPYMKRKRP